MNKNIEKILNVPQDQKFRLFEESARRMNVDGALIEKDFWVCAVLDVMFNKIAPKYKEDELFLFKGGTSLSKCFDKIDRFSEDIDIVVSRQFLGFHGDNDPLNPSTKYSSNKKRRAAIKLLAQACSHYITVDLKSKLEASLPMVTIVFDDTDQSTLHVEYLSCYSSMDNHYVRSAVKIEGGAKSAVIPSSLEIVQPYIANIPELNLDLTIPNINSISPQRTLLDKLLILHGWNQGVTNDISRLPNPENRLSRHYYDVAKLWGSSVGHDILLKTELLESVRSHNINSGFARAWMKTNDVTFETLDIVPNADLAAMLREDYRLMQNMLFGNIPTFDCILGAIIDMDTAIKDEYSISPS